MKLEHLKHLLRASGRIIDETQFFVIGSQSILGKYPNAPLDLLWSTEADLIAKNKKRRTAELEVIGELSPFHDSHGYYVDPVSEGTAILARGWKGRLINICDLDTDGVSGLCLDPHDLFISKVAAYRPKDVAFVKVMIAHRMVDRERVLDLARGVPNPIDDLGLSARIVGRIEVLFHGVSAAHATPIDHQGGRYVGPIVSVSDTVVQQDIGRRQAIFHEADRLDCIPAPGSSCTITYRDGRGTVVEEGGGAPGPGACTP